MWKKYAKYLLCISAPVAFAPYGRGCIPWRCIDVLSMFVLSKWQRVALLMHWRASVRALFYSFHTLLDHSTNIIRKMHAPRRVSASGAPNDVQNCHLDKINMENSSMHRHSRVKCPAVKGDLLNDLKEQLHNFLVGNHVHDMSQILRLI